MKYAKIFLILGLVLSITSICFDSSKANQPKYYFYEIHHELRPYPSGHGPTSLYINVIPHNNCTEVTLKLIKNDNVIYNDPQEVTLPVVDSNVIFKYDIELQKDTSGLDFFISSDGPGISGTQTYWAVENDTVKSFHCDPRELLSTQIRNKEQKLITVEDRRMAEGGPIDSDGVGTSYYTDGKGNRISEEEYRKLHPGSSKVYAEDEGLDDTAYVWQKGDDGLLYQIKKSDLPTKEEQKIQRQIERLHKMEESPLTERESQHIMVGDTLYTRNRGEYKFHQAEMFTDFEAYGQKATEVERAEEHARIYEITLDLRDPQEFEYVKGLVDSLVPMEEEGFYRATVTGAIKKQLRANKIKLGIYPEKPYLQESSRSKREKINDKSDTSSSEKEPPQLSTGSWVTPFWDNFEYFVGGTCPHVL
ncbi:MAG: hypothetical protein ACOYVF_12735 [Candidatus Zixiibacteriota bacterium]